MKAVIIIPARYASSRLPGKPLLAETGKPLIQHTYEQASRSSAAGVIVATDDERIDAAVKAFGGESVLTSPAHETGTTRVAEAASDLSADIIVNLQGDEPETNPADLDLLIDMHTRSLRSGSPAFASTLVCPFPATPASGPGSPADPSCVKAVISPEQSSIRRALYFSRSLVPYPRDDNGKIADPTAYYLHIGVYAFGRDALQRYSELPGGRLENIEKLEQLRILESGHSIAAAVVGAAAPGIDTPDDYAAFVSRHRAQQETKG